MRPRSAWTGWACCLWTLGLAGVTFALLEWQARASFAPWLVPAVAALGAPALAGFVIVERTSDAPMVSIRLFHSRNFTGANLITLFLYASLGGLMFFFPMDLIQIQHYTATQAGAAFLPFVVLMFALSRWSGGLVERHGSRMPLTIGPLIAAGAMAWFAVAPQNGHYWTELCPPITLFGLGMTISVAPLSTTVMNSVPESESGLASGINNAVSRLAALLAVAVFGTVLVMVFNHSLDQDLSQIALAPGAREVIDAARPQLAAAHNPDARVQQAIDESFVLGYRAVIWIAMAGSALSAIVAWFFLEPGRPASE